MPRNLPFYTQCASPDDAHSYSTAGNIVLQIVFGILVGGAAGGAFAAIMALLGFVAGWGCIVGIGVGGLVIYGIVDFKHWYYNERLMCIQHDQCATGSIVSNPTDAQDGDRKMDILVSPFTAPEVEQLIIELLDEMRGELTDVPDLVDLQNRQIRVGYINGMPSADKKRFYIRLTEEKMFTDAGNSYQKRYYRRDETEMGSDAFNASDDDTLAAEDPNLMFRYNGEHGNDPNASKIVPYMHCEVEGNRLARWLDNVLAGVIAGLVTYTALCVACTMITMGALDFLCGWIGGLISAIIAILAWLIAHLVNDPDDGVASSIDVDVEDTDFDTPPSESQRGDVVLLFGDWVMDTEHDNYFELHPVKAYYLLCRNGLDEGDWQLTEETPPADCDFDPSNITAEDLDRMCRIVKAVENTDPNEGFTTNITHGLAMMP